MTSVATTYYAPLTPPPTKKRHFIDYSENSGRQPIKRLQSLNLPSKFSGSASKAPIVTPKLTALPTGLEGALSDINFVEATKATEEDEARRNTQPQIEPSQKALIMERRYLASRILASGERSLGKGRGLSNLTGALCYRHSLFQALFHTPKFVYWLKGYHKPQDCVSDNRDDCLSCQMRRLMLMYWKSECKQKELIEQLRNIHELFKYLGWKTHSTNGHGDPDDQLAWMLDVMRSEMPTQVFNYFDAFHNSILESEIRCNKCGHASKTQGNNERHLSIPIKVPGVPARHLQLLIKAYMDEVIQGYRCENEKCKHVSDIHRIQKIAYAPDVLLIQLKRFNFRGQKDSSSVQYSQRLDLTPHTANPSLGPLAYDLTAIISHSGSSSFGHYHCIAKSPHGEWLEFDDNSVYNATTKEALNPALIDRDWTPYLLFYERNKASMPPL